MSEKPLDLLKKYEDAVAACNRCGFCTSYCPTYNATGRESYSPRGRNQTLRSLIEGKLADPLQARESIDTCLLCGECTSVCFSEVPVADLMVQARNYLNSKESIPSGLSFFLKRILPQPQLFRRVLKAAFWAKWLGVTNALKTFGFLRAVAPTLDAADNLVAKVPLRFLMETSRAKAHLEAALLEKENEMVRSGAKAPPRPTVAYLPVCGTQYLKTKIGQSTLKILERLSVPFGIPEMACCGLPAASYGVMEEVRNFAKDNIERLERGQYEVLLGDDSSCVAHLKDYGRLFQGDPELASRAHALSQKFRDVAGFLLQRGVKDVLSKAVWRGGPVAYHDPCKAQYGQRATQAPRDILSAVPNLTLVPIGDADQCCGGGGTYSFVHPEISQQVLAAKIKNIAASGCKTVVTSSTSCLIQVAFGLRKAHSDIKVVHLTEFLADALSL